MSYNFWLLAIPYSDWIGIFINHTFAPSKMKDN